MPELAVKMLGKQQCWQGIDTHILQKKGGIDLPNTFLGAVRRGMQDACRIDQPVNLIQLCRPGLYRHFVSEVQPMPAGLLMIHRERVVIVSRDNFIDVRSCSEHPNKCTAYTTRSASDDNIHDLLPGAVCTGALLCPALATTTLLQHVLFTCQLPQTNGNTRPVTAGFVDGDYRLRIAGRVYHHAFKYLPAWPRAETKRPEGRQVYLHTSRLAVCCGLLNDHAACH